MKREIKIADQDFPAERRGSVWLTDEPQTALSLHGAGACVLFLLTPENEGAQVPEIEWCVQVNEASAELKTEEERDALGLSEDFLRKVWQRHAGLPWRIAETKRLRLRELTAADADTVRKLCAGEEGFLFGADMPDACRDFSAKERLEEYIRCMYGFYGFGLWAAERRGPAGETEEADRETEKADGVTGEADREPERADGVSKRFGDRVPEKPDAGMVHPGPVSGLAGLQMREGREEPELGFCIVPAFRGQGYALEACAAALRYGFEELELPAVRAVVRRDNEASLRLCKRLGFVPAEAGAAPDGGGDRTVETASDGSGHRTAGAAPDGSGHRTAAAVPVGDEGQAAPDRIPPRDKETAAALPDRDPAELRLTKDMWESTDLGRRTSAV